MSVRRALAVAAAVSSLACQKSGPLVAPGDLDPAARKDPSPGAMAPKDPAAPAAAEAPASQPGASDPECVGPLDYAAEEKLTLNGKPATLKGYQLALSPAPGPVVLGVVAGINDNTPASLKAYESFAAAFKAKGARAILVDGDTGDNSQESQLALKPFLQSGLPVLVLVGNRETKGSYVDAVNALRPNFPNLVNLNKVREVDFGGVILLSLPGYHEPRFIAPGGCQYHSDDLAALKKLASTLQGTLILAAHGMPHQDGAAAIDRTNAPSVNAGDPNLTRLLAEAHIPFGIFANIIEGGGKAANLKGDQLVAQNTPSDSFYLNPGAAFTTPWAMNDGTSAKGLAALVTIADGKGSWLQLKAEPAPVAATAGDPAQAKK